LDLFYCLRLFQRLAVLARWDAVRRERIDVLAKVSEIFFDFPEESDSKGCWLE
jgi:hypothetical protein